VFITAEPSTKLFAIAFFIFFAKYSAAPDIQHGRGFKSRHLVTALVHSGTGRFMLPEDAAVASAGAGAHQVIHWTCDSYRTAMLRSLRWLMVEKKGK
jgi:hypothetical protein